MRIALHAINGVGLGHLVRTWCVATALRSRHPDAAFLFVTNAADPTLLSDHGFDFVHLPPRAGEPHADPWRAWTGLPDELDTIAVLAALEAFGPDLVVFDTHAPAALVEAVTALGARTALILRELRPEVMAGFLAGPAARAFDTILLPHDADEVDPTAWPVDLPLTAVGPIVRPAPPCAPDPPDVLVVAGGGGQPVEVRRMLRAAADAHWLLRARFPALRTTLVAPPRVGRLPKYPGLTVRPPGGDVPGLQAGASVVVAQAGYNTVAELRAARQAAVFVPGRRRQEDQGARARRLADRGAALIARPEASSLARKVAVALRARSRLRRAHEAWPLAAGNDAAAGALCRLLRAPDEVRRVLLVAHDFPPRKGGMETVAARLAGALAADGLHVSVATVARVGIPELPGVAVHPVFTALPGPAPIDLRGDLPALVELLHRDRPDGVHLCHAGLAAWVEPIRAVWPCRVTVHLHGNDWLSPWVAAHPPEAAAPGRAAGLRAADLVVAVSTFSAGLARAAGVAEDRLAVVHNGVDLPATVGGGGEGILTVSRLARRKGHATVIDALAALPGVRYRFTGRDDALLAELRARAAARGVADRLDAVGFVPDEALAALFASARVFVLVPDDRDPNDVEGFGVALLEAAAAGLPVVASRAGGVPEAVEDGVTGILVPPGDPAATAAAVRRLLGDPALAAAMGAAGRARAAGFSWARAAAALRARWEGLAPQTGRWIDPGGSLGLGEHPAAFARAARLAAAARTAASRERRERFRREAGRGRTVRLRATGAGERLLAEALADAAAAGVVPDVELQLGRFLDPVLRAPLLAAVDGLRLHHSVPAAAPADVSERLEALPADVTGRIRTVHLHLRAGADALAVVPEIHALRTWLQARGVTVSPPPELLRYLSVTPSPPPTAMIEPTNRCNLRCPTCPTGTGKIAPKPDLTVEAFADVVRQLRPALRNLALWNYGEPTLHRALPELVAVAKGAGVGVVKISSNVHFLDGPRGAALLRSGLDVLILSVDGASQETYARFRQNGRFDRVAAAVRALCEEKRRLGLRSPSIELQFIAMRHNEHELPAIRALAAEWGVDRLRIKTFAADDDENRSMVPKDATLSRYDGDGGHSAIHPFCTRPWDHAVVNVDGSVTACCYLRPDQGPDTVLGNVFETPFVEIWRGARYRALRRRMLEGRQGMPVCGTCRGGTHDLLASVEEVP